MSDLAMTDQQVAWMNRRQREARVRALVEESRDLVADGIKTHVVDDSRTVSAIVVLYSGGNDSTTLAHMFRGIADYAAHANTGIGIEATREFVRNTCEAWGLPLIERMAPREIDRYRHLVLERGFPGPAMHFKMFTRLKERALEQIQREFVGNPYRERVVFLAGRRRQESKRRALVPEMERVGSRVYISPLVNWTKLDLNTYRLLEGDVPTNQVSDLIHMSGECLCGAFAAPGERAEIDQWFPLALDEVRELEALIADRDDIPEHRKTWGWGADPKLKALDSRPSRAGVLCSSCDSRFAAEEDSPNLLDVIATGGDE